MKWQNIFNEGKYVINLNTKPRRIWRDLEEFNYVAKIDFTNKISMFNNDALIKYGLFGVLSHDGLTRQFIVYVPTNYDSNLNYPLMINFHGFGGTASF